MRITTVSITHLSYASNRNTMRIYESVLNTIIASTPLVPPESGGILGGRNNLISCYVMDNRDDVDAGAIYVPDTAVLNRAIREWKQEEIELYGLYHTHFANGLTLSSGDKVYIAKIMDNLPKRIQYLYFPIVLPRERMIAYCAGFEGGKIRITSEEIEIIKGR